MPFKEREAPTLELRVTSPATVDHGSFAQDLELQPETVNSLELTVCDGEGHEAIRVDEIEADGRQLGAGVHKIEE